CAHVRTHDDPRLQPLTLLRIGQANHTRFGDRGMRGEYFLNLARPHLEAARLDQLFLAIDDEDVAVAIEIAEIAGVEGALTVASLAQHLPRRVGPLPIALHELRRLDDDLSHFADRELGRAVVGDDSNDEIREGHSDRTFLLHALRW